MTKARTVFYSWQSDVPNRTNRGFIQDALERVAEDLRVELAVGGAAHGIGGLGEAHPMRFPTAEVDDLQLSESVLPLARHQMVGEQDNGLDAYRLAVGDDLGPVLLLRIGGRSADHAIVDPGVVGQEVEAVTAMVAVVLVPFLASEDQARRRGGIIRRDHALFGGGLAVAVDEDPVAAERPIGIEIVQIVLLFEDQRIVFAAQRVAVKAPLPLGRVLDGVEDRLVVGGPQHRADSFGHAGLDVAAGAQVAHVQRVLAIADVVGRIGEQVAVVARLVCSEAHELLPLGHLVHVQHNLLIGVEGLLPRIDRILLALHRARVPVPAVVPVRHVRVGLLDVAEHLVVERLL